MAEAIAVIGVVSSIVQLIDFTSSVFHRLDDFQSSLGDVPKSLQHLKAQLPVLQHVLEQTSKAIDAGSVKSEVQKLLIPVIEGCTEQIKLLEGILAKVLLMPTESRLRRGAKAILSLYQDDKLDSITKILHSYVGTLTLYYAGTSSTLQPLTDAKLAKIRQWLSPPDPSINYQRALQERQADSGLWFLESDEYAMWKSNPASFLWLHGIPGCGKTVLSSAILQDVLQLFANDHGKAVVYFYFDFNDTQKQSRELMIRSLISQLSQQFVKMPSSLDMLFSSCKNGQRQPSLDGLLDVVRNLIREFQHVYIILDALDECTDRAELLATLQIIADWKDDALHLLVTSRKEQDIESSLENIVDTQNTICLLSELVDKDIFKYIRQRLSVDKKLNKWQKDPEIRYEIEMSLMKGAHGMFRWAVCQLDTFGDCPNRLMLRKSLASLPPTLDETYDRILCAIDKASFEYAVRILRWLAFSARPLLLEEVAEVVAIDLERNPSFDSDEVFEDPSDVLSICKSLVSIATIEQPPTASSKDASVVVNLAHHSVREYLISERSLQGRAARYSIHGLDCNEFIAESCISYLLQFQEPGSLSDKTLQVSKLALYAAKFWITHAQEASHEAEGLNRLILELFSARNSVYLNWMRIYDPDHPSREPNFDRMLAEVPVPLYYASLTGLTEVVCRLIEFGADVNAQGGYYGNPIRAASAGGHTKIVELLLDAGRANPDTHDEKHGRTPLSFAAERGHIATVEKLLRTDGVDPDSKSREPWSKGRTPLSYAAERGHKTVIELLMQTGKVDPDSKDDTGRTPLSYAVVRAETRTIRYLLENGANPLTIDIHQKGLLHYAISSSDCKLETVNTLLASGAPKDSIDDDNMTPLHYTSLYGGPDIAKLLIQNDVPVDIAVQRGTWHLNEHEREKMSKPINLLEMSSKCAVGLTPLHYAALIGNAQMVQFFLHHGADPNATSYYYGETPLHLTLCKSVQGTKYSDSWTDDYCRVEYVLELIDPEDDDANETYANVTKQRISAFDTLLRHPRIEVNIQDNKGATALHCLKYGFEECDTLTSKLIERGADLSLANSEEQTPLHLACRGKDFTSVEVLLSHGADISHSDRDGLNSLHWAAHSTNVETMSRILEAAGTSCSDVAPSVDNSGRNALHHLLVNLPNIKGVQLLVDKGVDVNGRDIDGNTPLAAYLSNRWIVDEQICRLLLLRGSDVLAINHQGLALPHIFSSWLHPNIEVLMAMMDYSIDLTAKDRDERTLLHHSALNGSITEPILSFLLDKTRLCCEDRDSLGRTPKEYAVEEAGKKRHKFAYERKRWSRSLEILERHEEST